MQDLNNQSEQIKASRRQLLRMGAVGMPMVLTMRASASQVLISQLQCGFSIPRGTKILVDDQGQAWVSDSKLRKKNQGNKVRTDDIAPFKSAAENSGFVFPAGNVSQKYRPSACAPAARGNDCGWGNDLDDPVGDNDDEDSCNADPNRNTPWFEEDGEDGEPGNRGQGYGGQGNDSKHGGSGSKPKKWTECGYKVYSYDTKTIKPGDFVTGNGNWNLSGSKGLYIELSIKYNDTQGQMGGWPGISCIVSILNYLGQ